MTCTGQRPSVKSRKVAADQRRIPIEGGRHPLVVTKDQRHIQTRICRCRIARKQPINDVRAPAQRRAH